MSAPADTLSARAPADPVPAAAVAERRRSRWSGTAAAVALLVGAPPLLNWLVLTVGLGAAPVGPLFFGATEGVGLVAAFLLTRWVKDDLARVWGDRPELAESLRKLRPGAGLVAFLFAFELAVNWTLPATAIIGLSGMTVAEFLAQVTGSAAQVAIWLGAVPLMSLCMALVLAVVLAQVGALAHAARGVEIDILTLDRYAHLANPLVRVLVFFVALLSVLPAFAILGGDEGLTRIMVLSLPVGLPLVLLFVGTFAWPVWILRERIRAVKRAELALAHRALAGDEAAMLESRVGGRERPLTFSELLAWRAFVDSLGEWPVGPSLKRVAFFGVVPPITWVLAGLVENAVGSLVP